MRLLTTLCLSLLAAGAATSEAENDVQVADYSRASVQSATEEEQTTAEDDEEWAPPLMAVRRKRGSASVVNAGGAQLVSFADLQMVAKRAVEEIREKRGAMQMGLGTAQLVSLADLRKRRDVEAEGSGAPPRAVRQVLGEESPVPSTSESDPAAPQLIDLVALAQRSHGGSSRGGGRDDSDGDRSDRRNGGRGSGDRDGDRDGDRHRPPTGGPFPSGPSCATVRCTADTECVMENGRPICRQQQRPPQQSRSCRDVNCPRDTRCIMQEDRRCSGRFCSSQPVCVRFETSPSGPSSCLRVQCPFGTACRFDGREALCVSLTPSNPCLTARCANGFECRVQGGRPLCFPVFTATPAPTPAPQPECPGQNELMATCATFCEPTCVAMQPACVLACAPPRCQCAPGTFRNHQGVCVAANQCEPACGANEVFNQCGAHCEAKCGQPAPAICATICNPAACMCKPGFWRHPSGACVQQQQCFVG